MPNPSASQERQFFSVLMRCGSLSATARELQVSTPAISKRLAALETRLGVQLLNRTTRRLALTHRARPTWPAPAASWARSRPWSGNPLAEDGFDVCVRFGEPPDARVVARLLAPNRRLLCASPAYLQKHAVNPARHQDTMRVRAFVEHLAGEFARRFAV
jgi:LysR family transcriptional activator of dmlA